MLGNLQSINKYSLADKENQSRSVAPLVKSEPGVKQDQCFGTIRSNYQIESLLFQDLIKQLNHGRLLIGGYGHYQENSGNPTKARG